MSVARKPCCEATVVAERELMKDRIYNRICMWADVIIGSQIKAMRKRHLDEWIGRLDPADQKMRRVAVLYEILVDKGLPSKSAIKYIEKILNRGARLSAAQLKLLSKREQDWGAVIKEIFAKMQWPPESEVRKGKLPQIMRPTADELMREEPVTPIHSRIA